jgi:MFS family permease
MNTVQKPINPLTKMILLLGANVALMAGASLTPGMPAMMAEFENVPGAGFWVSMIITLPALFVVIGGPITGFFTDRFGRKPVLVVSLLLSGLSGSAGFFLNSIGAILVTRALVGLSIAGATTATNSLIADYFEGQERAKFMGIQSAFTGLGGVVFLPLGGILADLNWHYSFLAHLPLLILFPLALIFIHEPEEIARHEEALESKLKLNPTKIYIFAAILLGQFSFVAVPVFLAYYLTALLGVGGTEVGLIGAASSLFSFFAGLLYERISRRIRYREMAIFSFFLSGCGFMALGLAKSWSLVIIGELIIGFSMGLIVSNLTTWLASEVSPQVRGRANGIFFTMMFLGQFFASIVYTPIVNATSLDFAYILSAVIIILTGLAGLFLRRDTSQQQQ